jgi:hypothetical protein
MNRQAGSIKAHKAMLILPLALLLAGCGGTKLGEGEVSEGERRFTEKLLFPTQKLPEAQPFNKREFSCPAITLQDGTASWRVGGDSARGVSHQASIHDFARECSVEGGIMRVKVGVSGRVVMGEAGRAGGYAVPVRVVVREGDRTVHSRVVSTSVSVPDSGSVPFVVLDDAISLNVTDKDPGDMYSILVGLDPQGNRGKAPAKKRRR